MKPRREYNEVVAERVNDLRVLFAYFAVTRVKRCREYEDVCVPGVFSWDRFKAARNFYIDWKRDRISKTFENRGMFRKLQDAWNDCVGIPSGLLDAVIGHYRHERINRTYILSLIVDYKHVKGGNPMYKGKKKKPFDGFFVPTNEENWKNMFLNPNYSDYKTIPNASERIKGIIKAWEESQILKKL